jgi:hypothetical protein
MFCTRICLILSITWTFFGAFFLHSQPLPVKKNQQPQTPNQQTMDHFKASPNAVLVATDVAARGLDVKGVGAVVHYDLPRTADAFVHRR